MLSCIVKQHANREHGSLPLWRDAGSLRRRLSIAHRRVPLGCTALHNMGLRIIELAILQVTVCATLCSTESKCVSTSESESKRFVWHDAAHSVAVQEP